MCRVRRSLRRALLLELPRGLGALTLVFVLCSLGLGASGGSGGRQIRWARTRGGGGGGRGGGGRC